MMSVIVGYSRENVGLLGLTRVGSRRVVQISAGFMIFFSTLGQYSIDVSNTSFDYTKSNPVPNHLINQSCFGFYGNSMLWEKKRAALLKSAALFHFGYVQESLELCLHPYPSQYLLHCTVFSLALLVRSEIVLLSCSSSSLFTNTFPCSSAAVGISFLQFTNMNSMRNLIITGLTLFLGISVPQFFSQYWTSSHHGPVHTNAGWVSVP